MKREWYHLVTPAQAVVDIAAENATKQNAMKGYHQYPFEKDNQDLTTFITPFGQFKFLRAPYGISSISEHYNRRTDEAFAGLLGFGQIVDDILIYDSDTHQHTQHVWQFLQRCTEKQITLNIAKWEFAQPTISFAGFNLPSEGYHINPAITHTIANFPTPANHTDLRSFIGLLNQLSASTVAVARLLAL